jgi:hypothetical protein
MLFCHKKGQPVSPALLGQLGPLIFLFAFQLFLEGFSGAFKFRLENCWGNVRLPFMPDGSLCLVFNLVSRVSPSVIWERPWLRLVTCVPDGAPYSFDCTAGKLKFSYG